VNDVAGSATNSAPQALKIRCKDGRELAATWFSGGAPARRAGLLISPATGFPQTFYFKLAGYAATRGFDTLVYDYRGMGRSAPPDLSSPSATPPAGRSTSSST